MSAWDYLDLYDLFVNEIAGTVAIFIFLSLVVITYIASKFRFPNGAMIMIIGLFAIIFSAFFDVLLPLAILVIGLFAGWQIVRLVSR